MFCSCVLLFDFKRICQISLLQRLIFQILWSSWQTSKNKLTFRYGLVKYSDFFFFWLNHIITRKTILKNYSTIIYLLMIECFCFDILIISWKYISNKTSDKKIFCTFYLLPGLNCFDILWKPIQYHKINNCWT